jgi:molecular chaperone GrpE
MPSKRDNDQETTASQEEPASRDRSGSESEEHPAPSGAQAPASGEAGAGGERPGEVADGEGGAARVGHEVESRPAEAREAVSEGSGGAEAAAESAERDRRVEELASQLEEANGRYLRLAADFDNFKKRARQEQLETMRFAAATVAERLLPVLDDAKLALDHAPEGVDENWLKGVRLTFQKLEEVLASVGVERIEAIGVRFDPNLHEAVGSEESGDHPEDTVIAELRPGYRMHDRVLRPALVRVARPPSQSE